MKTFKVSPRNEEILFGDASVGFSEFLKYADGVLTSTGGETIEINQNVVKLLSNVEGQLYFNGTPISEATLPSILQRLSEDTEGNLLFDGTKIKADITMSNVTVPAYSTDEVLTERRWIDGKPIYQKIVYVESELTKDDVLNTVNYSSPASDLDTGVKAEIVGVTLDGSYEGGSTPREVITEVTNLDKTPDVTGIADIIVPENISYSNTSSETVDLTTNTNILVVDGSNTGSDIIVPENIGYDYISSEVDIDVSIGDKVLIVDGSDGVVGNVYQSLVDIATTDLSTIDYSNTSEWTDLGAYVAESTIPAQVGVVGNVYTYLGDNLTASNLSLLNFGDTSLFTDLGAYLAESVTPAQVGVVGNVYTYLGDNLTASNLRLLNFGDTGLFTNLGAYVAESTIPGQNLEITFDSNISKYQLIANNPAGTITVNGLDQVVDGVDGVTVYTTITTDTNTLNISSTDSIDGLTIKTWRNVTSTVVDTTGKYYKITAENIEYRLGNDSVTDISISTPILIQYTKMTDTADSDVSVFNSIVTERRFENIPAAEVLTTLDDGTGSIFADLNYINNNGVIQSPDSAKLDGKLPSKYVQYDETNKIPASALPSFVDDILEYSDVSTLPVEGSNGKIYITLNDNSQYRWSGTQYIKISSGSISGISDLDNVTAYTPQESHALMYNGTFWDSSYIKINDLKEVSIGINNLDDVITWDGTNWTNKKPTISMTESDVVIVTDDTKVTYYFSYNPKFIQVYVNRKKLRKSEFTAENGSEVTFIYNLAIDDEIEVVSIVI